MTTEGLTTSAVGYQRNFPDFPADSRPSRKREALHECGRPAGCGVSGKPVPTKDRSERVLSGRMPLAGGDPLLLRQGFGGQARFERGRHHDPGIKPVPTDRSERVLSGRIPLAGGARLWRAGAIRSGSLFEPHHSGRKRPRTRAMAAHYGKIRNPARIATQPIPKTGALKQLGITACAQAHSPTKIHKPREFTEICLLLIHRRRRMKSWVLRAFAPFPLR